MTIPTNIAYWLLFVPLVPSVGISIFNLYHLLASRALRTALNNHVIILLLVCGLIEELTDTVWIIYLFHTGTVLYSTSEFCHLWITMSSTMIISIFLLMAWASIERHILVFHSKWFASRWQLLFFHYIPLLLCMIWPLAFYLSFFIFLPCDWPLDFSSWGCSLSWCAAFYPRLALVDSILHYAMPSFTIVVCSLTLFIRVLRHRYQIHQRIDWRNYKKMAAQLLPLSVLYLFMSFPPALLYAAYALGLPTSVGEDYFTSALFFYNWIVLLTPFATVFSLPDLPGKCRRIFLFWRKRSLTRPEPFTVTRMKVIHGDTMLPPVAC